MVLVALLAFIVVCTPVSAVAVGLLKTERSKITFVPYTPQQRQTVAQYAKTLFSVYVHREVKIQHYGNEYTNIDPIPRIEWLVEQSTSMTDQDFHYKMSSLFHSLCDDQYVFPGPHKCFKAYTGLSFQFVQGGTPVNPIVVVSDIIQDLRSVSPGLNSVNIGDELVSIDGETFREFAVQKRFSNGGTNLYNGQRHTLSDMSIIDGKRRRMPSNDSLKFVFKNRLTNIKYDLDLPWVTARDDDCYSASVKVIAATTGKQYAPESATTQRIPDFVDTAPKYPNMRSDSERKNVRTLSHKRTRPFDLKLSDEISWDIFRPRAENVGVLRITSFRTSMSPEFLVSRIRSLLVNQLRETNALVIDVRGNTGGLGVFANILPQLFAVETGSILKRRLNAGFNRGICLDDPSCYVNMNPSETYLKPTELTPSSKLRTMGMAYLKPVAILNDGRCFSACDVFSATMQDWDAALIIGEDGQTGGGGASVLNLETDTSLEGYFPRLPFSDKNETIHGSPHFTVAWEQGLRQGKNLGALIEDVGVKSDVIIRPLVEDLLPDARDSSQFTRIAQELAKYGQITGKSNLYFTTDVDFQSEAPANSALMWTITTQGIASLILQDEQGSQVAALDLTGLGTNIRQQTQWNIPAHEPSPVNRVYTILGKSEDGRLVLRTIRQVRYTPPNSQFRSLVPGEVFRSTYSGRSCCQS